MISGLDFLYSVFILLKKGYFRLPKHAFQAWKSFVSMRPRTVKPVLSNHLKIDKT